MLPALVTEVKKMTYGPTKDVNVQYSQWSMALAIFVTMITDLEKTRTLPLLKTSLKHSGPFISHFVREGRTGPRTHHFYSSFYSDCYRLGAY